VASSYSICTQRVKEKGMMCMEACGKLLPTLIGKGILYLGRYIYIYQLTAFQDTVFPSLHNDEQDYFRLWGSGMYLINEVSSSMSGSAWLCKKR